MLKTKEYIQVTYDELEQLKQEAYDKALAHLIKMVPGAPGGSGDRTIDINNFDAANFDKMTAEATKQELRVARQFQYPAYELKTIPYKSWSEHKNILIEVGKNRYDDERGSLFSIKSPGWIHQLLNEDGSYASKHEFSVEWLKKRYELLKDNPKNFIHCENERSQWGYCMPIDFAINDNVLINKLEMANQIIKDRDAEINMLVNKLKQNESNT